jgi:transcription elongation factor Elf1
MELYKRRETQLLLSKFLSGEVTELEPAYDARLGYRYPTVEAIVGNPADTESFLKKLHDAGILGRKLFDKIVSCPKCSSSNVSIHYCCPYCKSFDIQKSSLIEHVKCGYMDVEENFRKSGKLICPKCSKELKKSDIDYRRAGIWCVCKDCGKSFDIPVNGLFCRNCHLNFTFEDAVIKDVYSYRLKEEAKQEAGLGWVLVAPMKEFLTEIGMDVEGPAFLKGKSGTSHTFDVVAKSKDASGKATVIDLATSLEGSVSEQPVIALFAKIFDVSPQRAFLVAIPRMNDNGKKMAKLYNIRVIEARDQKEAVKSLATMIKK